MTKHLVFIIIFAALLSCSGESASHAVDAGANPDAGLATCDCPELPDLTAANVTVDPTNIEGSDATDLQTAVEDLSAWPEDVITRIYRVDVEETRQPDSVSLNFNLSARCESKDHRPISGGCVGDYRYWLYSAGADAWSETTGIPVGYNCSWGNVSTATEPAAFKAWVECLPPLPAR